MVDAWTEWGLLTITASGGSDVEFSGAIDRNSLEIAQGSKDFDVIQLLNGGCLEKPNPEEPITITFDGYFVDLDTTSDTGILQLFHQIKDNWDNTQPLEVSNSHNRDSFKVTVLFTDDRTLTKATDTVSTGKTGLRVILQNARFVEATPVSFGDGILKITCKFKAAPYTKANASNLTWQSTDGTADMSMP